MPSIADQGGVLSALGLRLTDDSKLSITGADGIEVVYAIPPHVSFSRPAAAVLLDLDGTSLKSEEFWVGVLDATLRSATSGDLGLSTHDRVILQGSSTRAHLEYVRKLYSIPISLNALHDSYINEAEHLFFGEDLSHLAEAIHIAPGFAKLRTAARDADIPLILVTNGNRKKALREMDLLGHHLGLDPHDVADGVWSSPTTAGWDRQFGSSVGKPHPWPYLEAATRGAGVPIEQLSSVLAVDDSAAGVCSIRLAGMHTIGMHGGNIMQTGAAAFCDQFVSSLDELVPLI